MSQRTIWKYDIDGGEVIKLTMPVGARPLAVQCQGRKMCLWAEVEPGNDYSIRTFVVLGTGSPMPNAVLVYIGTVQREMFVWHVYEAK